MVVNKEIQRGKELRVKAIQTYLAEEQVIADFPLEDKGRTFKIVGEGKPRLRISKKLSKRYGEEIEIIFFGKRKIERYKSHKGYMPKTFGYIVLNEEQIKELIEGLKEIIGGDKNE